MVKIFDIIDNIEKKIKKIDANLDLGKNWHEREYFFNIFPKSAIHVKYFQIFSKKTRIFFRILIFLRKSNLKNTKLPCKTNES